jgi:predicted enzyme related to lactoylglutathione lyase
MTTTILGLHTIIYKVSDLAAEYKRFVEAGAKPIEAPMSVGDNIMVATVKDPWANLIGLIYNPHFK